MFFDTGTPASCRNRRGVFTLGCTCNHRQLTESFPNSSIDSYFNIFLVFYYICNEENMHVECLETNHLSNLWEVYEAYINGCYESFLNFCSKLKKTSKNKRPRPHDDSENRRGFRD